MSIDDSEAGSGTKSTRKPTVKQDRFAAAYADPGAANGNGTLAAKLAGYRGDNNQLAVQASVNLRNPKVQQAIASIVNSMTEHALHRLGEVLDATKSRAFLDRTGNLVYTEPVPDHKVRLDAIEFLFDLRAKFGAVAPEQREQAAEPAEAAEPLSPTDRALFEEAAEADAELRELDREPDDAGGDHDADE